MVSRGRNSLEPPQWWLDECKRWADSIGQVEAGNAAGYSHGAISKYCAGKKTSPDMTLAIARARKVEPPILIAEHPLERDWLLEGRKLLARDPEAFAAMMAALGASPKGN